MKKKKSGKRKPNGKPKRQVVLGMVGSPEYAEWLKRVSDKTGIPKTVIVRQALIIWASIQHLDEPPQI